MKKGILITAAIFAYCLLQTAYSFSQGTAINSNGNAPAPSALLDLSSTSQGLLIPRMTTTERNNITSPEQSLLIFNLSTKCFEFYYSSSWHNLGCTCSPPDVPVSAPASCVTSLQFTANWNISAGATGYFIDVSTDNNFGTFIAGYNNLYAGNVVSINVTGLTCGSTYYYRVRGNNSCGSSGNSSTISTSTPGCITCGSNVTFTYRGGSVTYGTVSNAGKCWLDRNLGASQVATAYNDANAYGDLFQWGRLDDGHQDRASTTTGTLSTGDIPGHNNFIVASGNPYDWRSPQNDNLWQSLCFINNPCPSGFRLPTDAELTAEFNTWSTKNAAGAYASPLKFTLAGIRIESSGSLYNPGGDGDYWTSTVTGIEAGRVFINPSTSYMTTNKRGAGFSVRCIKD